jgi:general secretion pathway protein H
MKPGTRNQRGFTLLELIVVLGILALVLAIAPPALAPALDQLRIRTAARDVAAALRLARNTAVSSGRETTLSLDVSERRIAVNDRTRRLALPQDAALTLTTARVEQQSESEGAIRFFPDGSSTGGRVTLEHGSRRYRIDVNWITGAVAVSR